MEETLRQAQAAGLLNDTLFARLWVEDRLLFHPLSRRAVERELVEKGIEKEVIQETLEKFYSANEEKRLLLALARERFARYCGLEKTARMRRLTAYLVRRGFSFPAVREVVRALEETQTGDR